MAAIVTFMLIALGVVHVTGSHSFGQTISEICNNAIDDDGDGLIDLNDPD